eukprot:TRINITY_DN53477_c0_g1_i1.p1 TRINITY_DN53477_c0_g1~~TRINITY_DN53477_c0_g1_i1.p1  ORF type:complete len:202 (+),score=11.57 TRINITY_DN53477_c0_g1_i1:41-646(+)
MGCGSSQDKKPRQQPQEDDVIVRPVGRGGGRQKPLKIVMLGDGRVGKTSLISSLLGKSFTHTPETKQAYYSKYKALVDQTPVSADIWDTAGQEKFHALGPIYYRDADGCMLVYDVTDGQTFEGVKRWVKELRQIVGDQLVLAVAGNKMDLVREVDRQVEEKDAKAYCSKIGASHHLTSAKHGNNVETAYHDLLRRVMEKKR